jgi:transposase
MLWTAPHPASECHDVVAVEATTIQEEPPMEKITTVGVDIAKSVFQVHGVDAQGTVAICRQLKRRQVLPFFKKLPACLIGIEACATSHHWSRELQALGHTVRLMPARYVKAYVKRGKNDAADAEAICEAVGRKTMRFVETKTKEQQAGLMLHRTRHLFIRQQTALINAIRAHLAEFGIVAPVGRKGVEALLKVVADPKDRRVPEVARECLNALGHQLQMVKAHILDFDRRILAWHRSNETSRRLDAIPGVGPALATALVASVSDPKAFRSARDFAAWIGLVPKQNSSGGKERLGGVTKQGDRYLRSLLTAGALAVIRYAKIHGTTHRPWLTALLARRPTKVAAIALANKIARMAWAMMVRNERYKEPAALAA